METATKLQGATTESHSPKTPEQQRDIVFTSIVETYASQGIKADVKQNGGYSSSAVNHGLILAGLAAINDATLRHCTAGKRLMKAILGEPSPKVCNGPHIEQI
jgi:hypothetical protein